MLSYEKCKQLKEAGFKQDTFLMYFGESLVPRNFSICGKIGEGVYSCPSFEEIWIQLPKEIDNMLPLTLDMYSICYCDGMSPSFSLYIIPIKDNNITEAAADLWLLLKKEGLI